MIAYPRTDDEARQWANDRKLYLKRQEGLSEDHAEALAFRELGYSHAGIASLVERNENTVSSYLEQLESEHGKWVTLTRVGDEIGITVPFEAIRPQ